jgi:hypothetical protein
MLLNATFNSISALSLRTDLLVEETGVPGENHRVNSIVVAILCFICMIMSDKVFSQSYFIFCWDSTVEVGIKLIWLFTEITGRTVVGVIVP